MKEFQGWYVDAVEQNVGALIATQRTANMSVDELTDMFLDTEVEGGARLSPEQHAETLALCLAVCVRRMARVDFP